MEPRLLTRRDSSEKLELSSLSSQSSSQEEPRLPLRPSPPVRKRKFLRRAVYTAVSLILLAVLGLLTAAIWLRHSMRAALPQIDGTLSVSGLTALVTVTRNAQGVPSIHAANVDDLLFAQGFITAQDRLWQMDMLRRHAAGELAEVLGPGFVEHDRRQRYLQLRAVADKAAETLPPDQLHELQAYARGVNAFIDSHRDHLPVEFHLLHYQPRSWTPRDTLLVSLVMWQDLSTSFPLKLNRESLSKHLPVSLLTDLYPVGSWRDRPPTQQPADLTTPHDILQIPLDSTQSKLYLRNTNPGPTARDLLAVSSALLPRLCADCRNGSNNWAISGTRSASAAPLLSNDMHLSLSAPDIWYEAVLHAASTPAGDSPLDVSGFTLPGVPWILVGRNAHVAWGFTNLGADVQDLHVEHLRGSGNSTEFQQPGGSWAPVQHRIERIVVRAGHDVSLDILTIPHAVGTSTVQTPIISPLYPSEHRALSLLWTAYDPAAIDFSLFGADSAADGASLVAAFAQFGGPSLNLIYADDHGHIGYHAIGRVPIRGPAVHHPRSVPQFVMPEPEPESDEDDSEARAPSRMAPFTPGQPFFMPAAYVPPTRRRRHRRPRPSAAPQTTALSQKTQKAPGDQPIPVPPVEQDFTIGSPLSPIPVDALNPDQHWSGYIPYGELPATQDPATGVLATANSRIVSDTYPYAVSLNWMDAYRVERIYRLLDDRNGLTPQAMLAIQNDQHSEFDLLLAQRVAYAIDHASASARSEDAARLRQASDLLRHWHGEDSIDSSAAAIVASVHSELWPELIAPQIAAHDHCSPAKARRLAHLYTWGERTTALEAILANNPARWLPPGTSNWNDLLTLITVRALRNAGAPHDLSRWRYGTMHSIEIGHPLFGSRPLLHWLLGVATGTGPQPVGGDPTTIDAIGPAHGPSERFTADLANPAQTFANITTGESGNPASPWYLDQFLPWLHGVTFRLPLNDSAQHTLILQPAS